MTALDNRFWKVNQRAIPDTLEHVSDRFAVVELSGVDKWTPSIWGCIDKEFSVGYIFASKCLKEQAIENCLNF